VLAGSVRTKIGCIDQTIAQLPQHFCFDSSILFQREQTATDAALICNDNEFEPVRFQTPQGFRRAGKDLHVSRIRTIVAILNDSSVAIDKNRRGQRISHARCPLGNWR
jgi:hypothetical protein